MLSRKKEHPVTGVLFRLYMAESAPGYGGGIFDPFFYLHSIADAYQKVPNTTVLVRFSQAEFLQENVL